MRTIAAFVLAVGLASCHAKTNATPDAATTKAERPKTTSAGIALGNLNADIDQRLAKPARSAEETLHVVELLLARAHYLGQLGDLDRAESLSTYDADKVAETPSGDRHYTRAIVHSALHRFDAAVRELDAAAAAGSPIERISRARGTIHLARGDYDDALALQPPDIETRDPMTIATAAVLASKMQKPAESERLFGVARARFHDVAPFPLAWMDFQRGTLAELAGEDARAETWFTEAVDILAPYAHAVVHLAPSLAPAVAIAKLEEIRKTSDDPEVLGALAGLYQRTGRDEDARATADLARARYVELIAKYPEAFADHAARFWLGIGGDPPRALALARENARLRKTEEALNLWMATAAGAKNAADMCAAATALAARKYVSERGRRASAATLTSCK